MEANVNTAASAEDKRGASIARSGRQATAAQQEAIAMGIEPFEFDRARQLEQIETRRNELLFSIEIARQLSDCLTARIDALQAGLSSIQRLKSAWNSFTTPRICRLLPIVSIKNWICTRKNRERQS